MSFVTKLWRGELPLYITFWFFGMIVGTVISVLVTNCALNAPDASGLTRAAWIVLALLYTGFMCVALWRSADKYKGAAIWSILARIYSAVLFMSFVSFAVNLASIVYPS